MRGSTGEQHRRQIGASDEKNQRDGTEQNEQCGTHSCHRQFLQWIDIATEAIAVRIIVFMLAAHLAVDHFDFRLCVREQYPRFQPTDDKITTVVANVYLFVSESERLPDVGAAAELATSAKIKKLQRKIESRRHDPDHGKTFAVEQQFGAENLRVAVKFSLPEPLADDDDIVAPELAFSRFKKPSFDRRYSE